MGETQNPWRSPVWLVLASIASVQVGATFAKAMFGTVEPATMAWLRMAIACPILLLVARPRLRGRTASEWHAVLGYGLALGTMNFAIYQSFARIPIGLAATIEFLGPLVVAFTGIRRVRDVAWIVLAAAGVVLLGWSPLVWDAAGIGWALLAAGCWAGYIVLSVPVGRTWSGISGVAVGSAVGAVVFAVPGLLAAGDSLAEPRVHGLAVLVALLSSVLPYGLEMVALRRINPAVFSILMSLEPAAAALAALLVLGETLALPELAAMACVIVASVGATRTMGRPSVRPDDH